MSNREITITTANSRRATMWVKTTLRIQEFARRLSNTVRSAETFDAYLKLPKSQQDDLKDVGGFVGGAFSGTRRKANELISRSLITLDLDSIPSGMTDDVLRRVDSLGCCATVYSTRKHAPWQPRLRVILYLDTDCTSEEYGAIARKSAELLLGEQMGWADPTTFEASRLMYYPSTSSDGEFIYRHYDKGMLSKDGMLALYPDWHDVTTWPTVPGHEAVSRTQLVRAGDPTEKKGSIGAFCKLYTVEDAMEKFLPGIYTPTDTPGRYSYSAASTTGGAVVYEDGKFLFSHHASDPICNQLVNAFDLVRIHKFGDLDDDAKPGTPLTQLPSFKAMGQFANGIPEISKAVAEDRVKAADVFDVVATEAANATDVYRMLTKNDKGVPNNVYRNVITVLDNDVAFKGKLAFDAFAGRGKVLDKLPWDSADWGGPRLWDDTDDAQTRIYMESYYGLTGKERIGDSLLSVSMRNRINLVEDYLKTLQWDGKPRIETLLIDYFGAEDNAYTRAVMKKVLNAACARAIEGGTKFDTMLVLVGPQGCYKTTFVTKLAVRDEWFTNSMEDFSGKDAADLIRGKWIVEVGELSALRAQDVNAVKGFISREKDDYRMPYGKHTMEFPRRCVFIGTTNSDSFLKDITGNRRFWPVDVFVENRTKNVLRDMTQQEVNQIWAEAFFHYILFGRDVVLNDVENALAVKAQERHMTMDDGLLGLIEDWLTVPVPPNWHKMPLNARSAFWTAHASFDQNEDFMPEPDYKPRTKVCAIEIQTELMHKPQGFTDTRLSRAINRVLSQLKGWEKDEDRQYYGPHGQQRGYHKKGEM